MSHIKRALTQMRNEQFVLGAIQRLSERKNMKFNVTRNAEPRGYGGKLYEVCDIVLNLPGGYDLGFKKSQETGEYTMIADSELFNGHYLRGQDATYIGKQGCEILKEYTICAALAQAEIEGHQVEAINYLPSGAIEVSIEVPEALMYAV